ncbi:MAG: V-type ATP synthase subunit F [Candidatus Hadarchaeales archaeon]
MKFKVAVIGDRSTVIGMALAGVKIAHVHTDRDSTLAALGDFMKRGDVGLIMITHRAAEDLGAEMSQLLRSKGPFPVVMRIPDSRGYVPRTDELGERLKRTVGAEISVGRS